MEEFVPSGERLLIHLGRFKLQNWGKLTSYLGYLGT